MKCMIVEHMFVAQKAWYENKMICMQLSDWREIRFPVHLNGKLKNASVEQLSAIEIICNGTGLHWSELDEDLSVTGIIEGRFGQ